KPDVVPLSAEHPPDEIEDHIAARMAQVADIIGGNSANIHPDLAGLDRLKGFALTVKGVIDLQHVRCFNRKRFFSEGRRREPRSPGLSRGHLILRAIFPSPEPPTPALEVSGPLFFARLRGEEPILALRQSEPSRHSRPDTPVFPLPAEPSPTSLG